MTPILILAAGNSSRMRGLDKLAQPVDGIPLLRHLTQQALNLGEPVFVALPRADHPRQALLAGLDITPIIVPDATEGMSGTMRGAVAQLPPCQRFMMVLGDLAEIDATDMAAVLAAADRQPGLIWRAATQDGAPGHPILFDASLIPQFANLHGDGGGETLVRPLKTQTVLVPLPGIRARRDLDTPEDWANFRAETGR